jgi:cation diffusion facilitator CzcD-associated flavoprotein CzcO
MTEPDREADVIVIGSGLAGLAATHRLSLRTPPRASRPSAGAFTGIS